MNYQPSKWLEWLAQTLVPSASREHTLGDISECSGSAAQYLSNLIAILPSVIWCQVRRRVHPVGALVIALLSGSCIGAAEAYFANAFFAEPWAWPRLAAPWAVGVIGGVLAAAYGASENKRRPNLRVLAATVVAALATATALGVPLAGVATGFGIVTAIFVLLALPSLQSAPMPGPLTPETLPEHARMFQKVIWWRNARESGVGAILIVLKVSDLLTAESRLDVLENLLLITGILFVIYYLHFRANSRPVPESGVTVLRFHRNELARQRDILRAVPLWYLLPLVPGIIAGMINNWNGPKAVLGLVIVAGVFSLVWRLNLWGARWLDQQLKDTDALQKVFE